MRLPARAPISRVCAHRHAHLCRGTARHAGSAGQRTKPVIIAFESLFSLHYHAPAYLGRCSRGSQHARSECTARTLRSASVRVV